MVNLIETPTTDTEKKVCRMFSSVFNIEVGKIGKNTNLFDLGSNSLNTIKILTMIERELKIKLNIKDVFKYPTIASLSSHIDDILTNYQHLYLIDTIEKKNHKEFPITSQQLGIYLDSVKNPDSILYNLPISLRLNDRVDIERIKEGFRKIFNEYSILRSKYVEKEVNDTVEINGIIDDDLSLTFEEYEYENVNTFVRPFELSKGPLIRVGFIKNEVLLLDMHHIISDGGSIVFIENELDNYYVKGSIKEVDVQFSDYAVHFDKKKRNGEFEKQIEFYKKMFDCDYNVLNIPKSEKTLIDGPKDLEEKHTENMSSCSRIIDKSQSTIINKYVTDNEISKTAFFMSIYGYVLSKYSNQDSIYTSIMTANRNNYYTENMIGMFVSTLPVLLKYDNGDMSFLNMIKQNMNVLFDVYNNQDISYSELLTSLKLKKINNSFIYQPKVTFDTNDKESIFVQKEIQNTFNVKNSELINENNRNLSKFDMELCVYENENDYHISIEFNNTIYNYEMIKSILESYVEVIQQIGQFNNAMKDIEYIPLESKEMIINKFNSNVSKEENNSTYIHEFIKVSKRYPEKPAIIFNNITISYKELDGMSNSLAYQLKQFGISRNDIVPIISERSPYFIIAAVAVSKAGGAYLPIDKNLPVDRIQYILNDVKP
ncbi:hypothetical protein PIROE2DRAFT_19400, partial [Piromyces sp. E2]